MTTYADAVAEAQRLVKRSEADQWRLAELTWEQVEAGKTRVQWAKDVGVDERTVGRWYLIWEHRQDHPADGGTYSETEAIIRGAGDGTLRQAEAAGTVRNLPPERQAEVARELLASPGVAERVVADDDTRDTVHKALDERYEQAPKPYPIKPRRDDTPMRLIYEFRLLHQAMDRIVRMATSGTAVVNDAERDALLDEVRWLRNALDLTESGLNAGSLDQALAALLDGPS